MDWSKMSETCFLSLSGGLSVYRESPLSEAFKGVIREELKKQGERRESTIEDCYAAADYVFATGIAASHGSIGLIGLDTIIPKEERSPYRGVVRSLFAYARQTNSESDESCEAFRAAIQCVAFLTDSEIGPNNFPLSQQWLMRSQKYIGNFFGQELPGDSLLPETRRLLLVARQALLMSREKGLSSIFKNLNDMQSSEETSLDNYFTAKQGMYRVIGHMMDDDFAFQGEFPSLEEAIECVGLPGGKLLGKYVYDDQGLLVW
ncbi:MAG: hypothetical protein WAV73_00320 [Candidatus Moraniibacteriota bacterium]